MKSTPFKDAKGRDINLLDLIMVDGMRVGWVWGVACQPMVGWDVVGPSCEDSTLLEEVLKDRFANVVVIGKINKE